MYLVTYYGTYHTVLVSSPDEGEGVPGNDQYSIHNDQSNTQYVIFNTMQQQLPMTEGVRAKILEYLEIENAPVEKQDEIISKIGEVAFKEILLTTLERLNEEQQKEYDQLLEEEAEPEVVEVFLKEAIPDYEKMVEQKIDDLMKSLKEVEE